MKVFISAGHSNTDPGAVGNGYKEAEMMAELRNLVAEALREEGAEVVTDGVGKDNWPLRYVLNSIKDHKPQVAVELHMNAAASPTATGVETISLPKDKCLSQSLSLAIANTMGLRLRGDAGWIDQSKSARGSLAFVNAGGLIVEVAFISNASDVEKYTSNKQAVAKAIAKTLAQEVGIK